MLTYNEIFDDDDVNIFLSFTIFEDIEMILDSKSSHLELLRH